MEEFSLEKGGILGGQESGFLDLSQIQPAECVKSLERVLNKNHDPAVQREIVKTLLPHLGSLMVDMNGSRIISSLIDNCSEEQFMEILEQILPNLVSIATTANGNFAIQKLVKRARSPAAVQMMISALGPHIVELSTSEYGHHVIHAVLKNFTPQDSQFIQTVMLENCVTLCTQRLSSCVVQHCLDNGSEDQQAALLAEVVNFAVTLAPDPFGNFVLQYAMGFGIPELNGYVIRQFQGKFRELAVNKFASNVVETCIRTASTEVRDSIFEELLVQSKLQQLLRDGYGNYVVQTSLRTAEGEQLQRLADSIRPHLNSLRNTPHYRKLVSLCKGNEKARKKSHDLETTNNTNNLPQSMSAGHFPTAPTYQNDLPSSLSTSALPSTVSGLGLEQLVPNYTRPMSSAPRIGHDIISQAINNKIQASQPGRNSGHINDLLAVAQRLFQQQSEQQSAPPPPQLTSGLRNVQGPPMAGLTDQEYYHNYMRNPPSHQPRYAPREPTYPPHQLSFHEHEYAPKEFPLYGFDEYKGRGGNVSRGRGGRGQMPAMRGRRDFRDN